MITAIAIKEITERLRERHTYAEGVATGAVTSDSLGPDPSAGDRRAYAFGWLSSAVEAALEALDRL